MGGLHFEVIFLTNFTRKLVHNRGMPLVWCKPLWRRLCGLLSWSNEHLYGELVYGLKWKKNSIVLVVFLLSVIRLSVFIGQPVWRLIGQSSQHIQLLGAKAWNCALSCWAGKVLTFSLFFLKLILFNFFLCLVREYMYAIANYQIGMFFWSVFDDFFYPL